MENNKTNIPTPPSGFKMPPPPPKPAAKPEVSATPKVETTQTVKAGPVKSQPAKSAPVLQNSVNKDSFVEEMDATIQKSKEKPKGSLARTLYWVGFAACLVGIGVLVFLLIK